MSAPRHGCHGGSFDPKLFVPYKVWEDRGSREWVEARRIRQRRGFSEVYLPRAPHPVTSFSLVSKSSDEFSLKTPIYMMPFPKSRGGGCLHRKYETKNFWKIERETPS
jgi:hypothetical protein